jgi:hypothetical protein
MASLPIPAESQPLSDHNEQGLIAYEVGPRETFELAPI